MFFVFQELSLLVTGITLNVLPTMLYHMSRVMKTFASRKKHRTAALPGRLVITLVILCLDTAYALCFFFKVFI